MNFFYENKGCNACTPGEGEGETKNICRTRVRVRVGCHQVTPAGGLHPITRRD